MNCLKYIEILAILFLTLICSCRNKDIDVDSFSIEREDVRLGVDTVRVEGTYDFFKEAESMKINIGCDSTFSDASSLAVALMGKDYAVAARSLLSNTTYCYINSVNHGLKKNFIIPTRRFRTMWVQNYTVNLTDIPDESGKVSGGGTYQYGQQCTVSATAKEGYDFINWTENDSILALGPLYTFIVNVNRALVANFCYCGDNNISDGIIVGKFSVSASQKVFFSQGNLQYHAFTNKKRFAENKYDCIANTNSNIGQYYNGCIDMFGWGINDFPHEASCYLPYSTSQRYYDYYVYGSSGYNLFDQTGLGDWGANPISNGGNQTCIWRTLSKNEWVYLLQTRNTSSGLRYAKARVAGKNGVILLPDDWSTSTYTLQNANSDNASFDSNVISSSDWNTLQSAGAVFLPAAGSRAGISISGTDACGYYWSSSYYDDYYACMLSFSNTTLTPYQNDYRYYGQSVRLVYEIKE